MVAMHGTLTPGPTWAYAHHLVPPQPADRLRAVEALLIRENAAAKQGDRVWVGRAALEQRTTHILVVSDSPWRDRKINRRLESALKRLQAEFQVTAPTRVADPKVRRRPPPAEGLLPAD